MLSSQEKLLAVPQGNDHAINHAGSHGGHSHSKADTPAEETEEKWYTRGLWQKPRMLVDWHESLTQGQRENEDRKVSWSELFFDLVFVTVVAKLGERLRAADEDSSSDEVLSLRDYILYFALVFRLWHGVIGYNSRFNGDDLYHKIFQGVFMLGMICAGLHLGGGLEGPNIEGFSISIASLHVLLAATNARVAWHLPRARGTTINVTLCHLAEATNMLLIFIVKSPAVRLVLLILSASCLSIIITIVVITTLPRRRFVPLDLEHFVERFGLFTILVLGETVNGIAFDPGVQKKIFFAAAFLGFTTVFFVKLLIFDVDTRDLDDHALRRKAATGFAWTNTQLILCAAIALMGSGLELICDAVSSDSDASKGIWYISGGLGAIMIVLGIVKLLHKPPTYPGTCSKVQVLRAIAKMQLFIILSAGVFVAVLPILFPDISALLVLGLQSLATFICVVVNLIDEYLENRWTESHASLNDGQCKDTVCETVV